MRFGKLVILVVPMALALWASSASAAIGCAGAPAASAINQYCETFPSSGGGHSPTSGSSTLANSLPPRVVRQLTAATGGSASSAASTGNSSTAGGRRGRGTAAGRAAARQDLLTLPAASIHRTPTQLRAASTGAVSLYSTLLIVLIAIALALVATTIFIARHRRAPDS